VPGAVLDQAHTSVEAGDVDQYRQ